MYRDRFTADFFHSINIFVFSIFQSKSAALLFDTLRLFFDLYSFFFWCPCSSSPQATCEDLAVFLFLSVCWLHCLGDSLSALSHFLSVSLSFSRFILLPATISPCCLSHRTRSPPIAFLCVSLPHNSLACLLPSLAPKTIHVRGLEFPPK